MPRVKIDYIVSFSSEDPDNPASNLLAWEVGKKKWLCGKGESSCSVVLQLTRAVQISAVHIGAHHAAFVEVLVGRSEKPNEDFQVLVPKCVLLSPAESRRDEPAARVRSFAAAQLLAPARGQRWDRARVVCSQPHNKHCKYGLSFVQIYEPEGAAPSGAAPARGLALDPFSSDEDEFKPGELFKKHLQKLTPDTQSNSTDTGAQIRLATSQALRNISDSASKLIKTPIAKTASKRQSHADECTEDRQRDGLLYTDDDDRPHEKIDDVVQRHKNCKSREDTSKTKDKNEKLNNIVNNPNNVKRDSSKESNKDHKGDTRQNKDGHRSLKESNLSGQNFMTREHGKRSDDHNGSEGTRSSKNNDSTANKGNGNENRKRPRSDTEGKGRASSEPHTLLQGAVLVLSGYQNPRRAAVRAAALALGARVQRDWGPGCTHLICAFPNTPKLRQVRAGPGGGGVPVARAEWLERCVARRRRLPWRWFATEPQHRRPPDGDEDEDEEEEEDAGDDRRRGDAEPDCDTDEEIERVLRDRKKHKTDDSRRQSRGESPEPPAPDRPDSDADRDPKRPDNNIHTTRTAGPGALRPSRYSTDTTNGEPFAGEPCAGEPCAGAALPDFFDGYTFLIDEEGMDARFDVQLLRRYVRAYGGVVVEASQLDEDSEVNYVICMKSSAARQAAGACAVRPDWVWRCHGARALLPAKDFAIA